MKSYLAPLLFALALPAMAAETPLPTTPPPGELGEMVKLGQDLIMHTDTADLTKDLVGNKLTCASCHIDGGTTRTIGTFIGTATSFPAYSAREGTVQTLQDRINNCFMRSMNGKRPIIDTRASVAMAAYVTWLSEGLPMKMNPKAPVTPLIAARWPDKQYGPLFKKATHENYVAGQAVYTARCAACHGANGEGVGPFPPLWGKDSYNAGAGMSKPVKMASWVQENMPKGNANLTPQEVADVVLYIDAQPRPDFDLRAHLQPADQMGYYNSKVLEEKSSVRSNLKAVGLDLDTIRGDGGH